jgi:hypothetical protein
MRFWGKEKTPSVASGAEKHANNVIYGARLPVLAIDFC